MRPTNLRTKIFLDGGDPRAAADIRGQLGFLDGQTTNPSLIAKNPEVERRLAANKKFTKEEILRFYRSVVEAVAALIPEGSVSIEVYADQRTTAREMLDQGKEMFRWIPNAHIKFPTTTAGLTAAAEAVKEGMRVNLTLCFSLSQAAAVYAATLGAAPGQVFVSPFVGRLDDIGENGMELIANILRLYQAGDGHVAVLTASVRNLNHFFYALQLGSDIITAPFKIIKEWADGGLLMPGADWRDENGALKPIPYQELDLGQPWPTFDIEHELTRKGVDRFAADWNALLR